MEKLLKAYEVADIMDMTEERIYALAREGILPTVRIGRQLRWSARQIEEFIENGGMAYPGGWKKDA